MNTNASIGPIIASYRNLEGLLVSLLVFVALFFYILVTKYNDQQNLKKILLFGFLVRIAVAALDQWLTLFPYGWDNYYSVAVILKQNFINGYPLFENVDESMHVYSYAFFSAFFYTIFGDHQLVMRFINAFLSILAAQRLYYLSMELCDSRKSATIAMTIMIFYPSFIVYGTLDMRDALFLFLSLDLMVRIAGHLNMKKMNAIIIFLELILLYMLRNQNLVLFSAILFTYLFFRIMLYSSAVKKVVYLISFVIAIAAIIIFLNNIGYLATLLDYINRDMRFRAATGGSSYLGFVEYHSWKDILIWMPVRFLYFLFGPFPWMINNMFMMYAFIETLFLTIIIFLAFSSQSRIAYRKKPKIYLFLVSYAFWGLFGNAIIDSNFGTAIRHKLNYIVIFFVLAAISIEKMRLLYGRTAYK